MEKALRIGTIGAYLWLFTICALIIFKICIGFNLYITDWTEMLAAVAITVFFEQLKKTNKP